MTRLTLPARQIVAVIAATITILFGFQSAAVAERRVVVEIRAFEFRPERPTVAVGDVVIFKNYDIVPHTVTATDDSWDSGLIPAGAEWAQRVSEGMVAAYYCSYHPTMSALLRIERE